MGYCSWIIIVSMWARASLKLMCLSVLANRKCPIGSWKFIHSYTRLPAVCDSLPLQSYKLQQLEFYPSDLTLTTSLLCIKGMYLICPFVVEFAFFPIIWMIELWPWLSPSPQDSTLWNFLMEDKKGNFYDSALTVEPDIQVPQCGGQTLQCGIVKFSLLSFHTSWFLYTCFLL